MGTKSLPRAARSQITGAHSQCVMRSALIDITWGKHSSEEMLLTKEGAAKGVHTEQHPCARELTCILWIQALCSVSSVRAAGV